MRGVAGVGGNELGGVRAYTRRLEAALRDARPDAQVLRLDGRGPKAWSSPVWVAAAAMRLAWLAGTGRIDAVHLMATERLSVWRKSILAAAARAFGLRVVMHHHGADFADWSVRAGPAARAAIRVGARAAHVNLVLGRDWATRLRRLGDLDAARVRLLPNALPDRPSPARRAARGPLRVLFLGVMTERKGPLRLLEALALLQAKGVQVEAVLAGDGPDRAAAEGRAATLGPSARFPGAVDEAGAVALMAWADLLAHPSTREGLPLTLLEAMRSGLPSLAFPAGAIEETLSEADGVRLLRSRSPDAWADAMAAMAEDRRAMADLGRRGRASFERRFRMERHAREVMECYGWRRPRPVAAAPVGARATA